MTTIIIEHPMLTVEERRARLQRIIDAGEALGAFHNAKIEPGVFVHGSTHGAIEYSKIEASDKPRWPCRAAETVRGLRVLLGDDVRPVQELLRAPPKKRKPVRKRVRNGSACHGKDVPCLPGLNGKCVACFDDD